MNKQTILTLTSAFVLAASFASCEDIIDVDLHSVEPELVIEGTVRMGEPAEVLITKTKDFDAPNDYPPVTDAVVVISDDDTGNRETLFPNQDGRYVAASIQGTERHTYHLSVTYGGLEYTATTYMPPRVEIDSLTLWKLPVKDIPDPQIHFVDPAGEENQYYRYVLRINGKQPLLQDRLEDKVLSTENMDGIVIRLPLFINYENSGRDDDPVKQGDVVTVEMQCLDKDVYRFFETLYDVGSAMANPVSNIKGGALGYFGAYSFTSKDVVMEWDE